jgi:hypothetical protein
MLSFGPCERRAYQWLKMSFLPCMHQKLQQGGQQLQQPSLRLTCVVAWPAQQRWLSLCSTKSQMSGTMSGTA